MKVLWFNKEAIEKKIREQNEIGLFTIRLAKVFLDRIACLQAACVSIHFTQLFFISFQFNIIFLDFLQARHTPPLTSPDELSQLMTISTTFIHLCCAALGAAQFYLFID